MLKRFFHGGNTGSNPVGDANDFRSLGVGRLDFLALFYRSARQAD